MLHRVVLSLCILLGSNTINSLRADLVFADFASTEGLQLNGFARTVANRMRLTDTATFSRGSFFSRDLFQLGVQSSFSTFARFQITGSGGIGDGDGVGADGLVFVLQTQGNNVGTAGGSIGYGGINNSLGVEFDTFNNGPRPTEPNGNHVGIDLNGSVESVATTLEPIRFNNGQIWNMWIDYDGVNDQLEVRWSLGTDRPVNSMLSRLVDLPSIIGQNQAYVGFTSATGNGFGFHELLSWEFRGEFRPIESVPEPNSLMMVLAMTVTAAATKFLRRRHANLKVRLNCRIPFCLVLIIVTSALVPKPARADWSAMAIEAFKKLGEAALIGAAQEVGSRGVDAVWDYYQSPNGTVNVAEFDKRLSIAEYNISQFSEKTAANIHAFREELKKGTSKERFREVVDAALVDMQKDVDARLAEVERKGKKVLDDLSEKVDYMEARNMRLVANLREMEAMYLDGLGYLPRNPPRPGGVPITRSFLASASAEPLLKNYFELLVESELSRRKIELLIETEPKGSRILTAAIVADQAIINRSHDLHYAARVELEARNLKKSDLLEKYPKEHVKVLDTEQAMAGIEFVAMVTKPVIDPKYGPRLGIPPQLFGKESGMLVASFVRAGGDPALLVPLFRQQLERTDRSQVPITAHKVAHEFDAKSQFAATRAAFLEMTNTQLHASLRLYAIVWYLDRKILQDQKRFEELHPQIVNNRKVQSKVLVDATELASALDRLLGEGLKGYAQGLTQEKLDTPDQQKMWEILMVLQSVKESFECKDLESAIARATAWKAMLTSANKVASPLNNYRTNPLKQVHVSIDQLTSGRRFLPATDTKAYELRINRDRRFEIDTGSGAPKVVDLDMSVLSCLEMLSALVLIGKNDGSVSVIHTNGKVLPLISLPSKARSIALSENKQARTLAAHLGHQLVVVPIASPSDAFYIDLHDEERECNVTIANDVLYLSKDGRHVNSFAPHVLKLAFLAK